MPSGSGTPMARPTHSSCSCLCPTKRSAFTGSRPTARGAGASGPRLPRGLHARLLPIRRSRSRPPKRTRPGRGQRRFSTRNVHRHLLLAFCLLVAWLPGTAHAATYDVIAADLTVRAVVQTDEGNEPVITRASFSSEDLQNLAMGRALGSDIPEGEVFAFAMYCPAGQIADSQLIIFDTLTSQVLKLVASVQLDSSEVAQNASTAVFVSQVDFQDTGDDVNGINDGQWQLGATASPDANGCPTSVRAVAIGNLQVNVGGVQTDVVVPRAYFRTSGKFIATIDNQQ